MSKTKIVIYGNCQAGIIFQLFAGNPEIYENFDVSFQFVVMNENQIDERRQKISEADIVLAQDVRDWMVYPFRDIAEKKRFVQFPFLYFGALWPFDAHQNQSDDIALAARAWMPHHLDFDFHDSLLAKLRSEIIDPEARFQAYRNLDYKRPINIKRYLVTELARLEDIGKRHNNNIHEFIADNFRQRRLFNTITHPTLELLVELASYICRSADITASFVDHNIKDNMSNYQVPLHPKVIEDLGIVWANNETRYRFRDKDMTFESYYRAYIHVYG
jgi:hypothetical protein